MTKAIFLAALAAVVSLAVVGPAEAAAPVASPTPPPALPHKYVSGSIGFHGMILPGRHPSLQEFWASRRVKPTELKRAHKPKEGALVEDGSARKSDKAEKS